MSRIQPVVIAGGPGARLWPLSGDASPKPFLKLDGERSLLDATLERLNAPDLFAPPIIACAAAHAEPARTALVRAGVGEPRLILEPEPRDTAAAIAAIAAARAAEGASELVLIAPADHIVADAEAFRAACASGAAPASEGRLVLLGATPTSAHEGFGYIEAAERGDVAPVASFHEKPGREEAEAFLASGKHLWNMGLFLASAATFVALCDAHAPDIFAAAQEAVARGRAQDGALVLDADAFARAPKAAFDRAVVEKARDVSVVRVDCGWSDVGAWDAVLEALPKDAAGNALVGDVHVVDVRDSLVHANGPRVAAIGVEGLAIVATDDAVLVCRLEDAQRVKALVQEIKDKD